MAGQEDEPKNELSIQSGLADSIEEYMADQLDDVVPTRGYSLLPLVGLGGSAGALPALLSFFKSTQPDCGMAFVVVLHLLPTQESMLAEVLRSATTLPVFQAEDRQEIRAGHIYVIPPGKYLTLIDGYIGLTELKQIPGKRLAVDLFFRSLAETHGPHAIAVVLSGVDGDGAIGIKRIKERGGLTVAQDPEEATESGMPRAAIKTGMIDWILRVDEIPQKLIEYRSYERQLRLPPETEPQSPSAQQFQDDAEASLRDILVYLRMRTGRDFSYYKRATILRRIARRMQVNSLQDLREYQSFLRTHPGEAGALLQDLLISVTNFFRDPAAFAALEQYIPDLFQNKSQHDSIRVWVPACATGEEAYSIAILLLEYARKLDSPPALQVFACDLDEEAIQVARAGLYTEAIAADIREDRLRRFFVKDPRGYRVRRELREMILFASHDLLKDAPFSKMDLISCRNLLIYLNRDAQRRAFEIFHFALKPEGRLFLGSSEAVDEDSRLFRVLDKKHRIYVQQPTVRSSLPIPARARTFTRDMEVLEANSAGPVTYGRSFVADAFAAPQSKFAQFLDRAALAELHFRLIERFSPPSVILNSEFEVVHLSENAGEYLQFAGGEISTQLLRVVHPGLRNGLRAALFRASETNGSAESIGIPFDVASARQFVNIRVSPAHDIAPGYFLVVFERTSLGELPRNESTLTSEVTPEPVIRHLERELDLVKGHLRDTVEQYEASTEELKASNEELQAMNEELRSATEELKTSREELESINEELTTVNQEMKAKVEEIASANSHLQNLMASTSIATVFLDRNLSIKLYTPPAVDLFNLISTDIGRPLAHLKHTLDYPELLKDAEQVLQTLIPMEREVSSSSRFFLARLQPYRTPEDFIGGVVLTFVDVTERKAAEQSLGNDLRDLTQLQFISQLLISNGDMQGLFNEIVSAATALMGADAGILQRVDEGSQQLHTLATHGLAQNMIDFFSTSDHHGTRSCTAAYTSGSRVIVEYSPAELVEVDETYRRHVEAGIQSAQSTPLIARSGRVVGVLTTLWNKDIRPDERAFRFFDVLARQTADALERKRTDEELRASEERLRLVFQSARDYAIFTTDTHLTITSWSLGAVNVFGYTEAEALHQSAEMLFHPADRAAGDPHTEARRATDEGMAESERWYLRKDGSRFYGSGSVTPLRNDSDELQGFVTIMRDLTETKQIQEAINEHVDELSRFNAVAVGREMRMIQLKQEVNDLCDKLGEPHKYSVLTDDDGTRYH